MRKDWNFKSLKVSRWVSHLQWFLETNAGLVHVRIWLLIWILSVIWHWLIGHRFSLLLHSVQPPSTLAGAVRCGHCRHCPSMQNCNTQQSLLYITLLKNWWIMSMEVFNHRYCKAGSRYAPFAAFQKMEISTTKRNQRNKKNIQLQFQQQGKFSISQHLLFRQLWKSIFHSIYYFGNFKNRSFTANLLVNRN